MTSQVLTSHSDNGDIRTTYYSIQAITKYAREFQILSVASSSERKVQALKVQLQNWLDA
ncbi:MAG: hypothetical protein U0931_08335 [Vulcanimicrobiota bacterium]